MRLAAGMVVAVLAVLPAWAGAADLQFEGAERVARGSEAYAELTWPARGGGIGRRASRVTRCCCIVTVELFSAKQGECAPGEAAARAAADSAQAALTAAIFGINTVSIA